MDGDVISRFKYSNTHWCVTRLRRVKHMFRRCVINLVSEDILTLFFSSKLNQFYVTSNKMVNINILTGCKHLDVFQWNIFV